MTILPCRLDSIVYNGLYALRQIVPARHIGIFNFRYVAGANLVIFDGPVSMFGEAFRAPYYAYDFATRDSRSIGRAL
jgi:hypothetical protein